MSVFIISKHFLWTIPFLSFLIGYLALSRWYPMHEFDTPNLIGLSIAQASIIASHYHLNIRILAQKEEVSLEPGTVLAQTPEARQKVKPQQSIFLVISKEPLTITMPVCIGKRKDEVDEFFTKQSVRARYYYVPSNKPKDYCVAQFPTAGHGVGQTIIIYLAQGTHNPVVVPNFSQIPVSDVLEFLQSYSVVTELIHEHSYQPILKPNPSAIVVDQRPLAGSIVTLMPDKPLHIQLLVRNLPKTSIG
jgi:beta-lactam-binding protein with PASTA domain